MLVRLRRRLNHGQSGSTLVSVIVIMMVLTMFAVTLATVVTSTTRVLVRTRETAQARQAADAGLAAALAGFKRTTDCSQAEPSKGEGHTPSYDVTCAVAGNVVTLISTGHAAGTNAVVKVEYEFEIIEVEDEVDHMTFYSGATFTQETKFIKSADGWPRISIAKGSFTCQVKIQADMWVKANFVANNTGCVIEGNVWAGGTIAGYANDRIKGWAKSAATSGINKWWGTIDGDFTAGTTVDLEDAGGAQKVGGNLKSSGSVILHKTRVLGNVTAPKMGADYTPYVTATWQSPPSASNPGWDLTGAHSQVGGIIIRPSSVAAPESPPSRTWRDYAYKHADWPGYAEVKLTAAQCNSWNSWPNQGWKDLANLTSPTIIDATACTNGLTSNNGGNPAPAIKTDLVIVASSFDLTSLKIQKSSDAPGDPRLWLIVPDTSDDDQPLANACSAGGSRITLNSTHLTVPTFLYTPGCVNVTGGGTFTGTMYSGGFSYGGQIQMTGVKVRFPGPGDGAEGGVGGGGLSITKVLQRECTNELCKE